MKERHFVTIYPDMCAGEPTIDGYGITVEQIARIWWKTNRSIDDIGKDYPGINRGAILVACWYQGTFGTRTWRARWQKWANEAFNYLWEGDYVNCPMPPRKELET